jgi:hypothetical protein
MANDATTHLTWYHKPFGRRVASPGGHPYFVISHTAEVEDADERRRRNLADMAGL